jgi:hypothetical protein
MFGFVSTADIQRKPTSSWLRSGFFGACVLSSFVGTVGQATVGQVMAEDPPVIAVPDAIATTEAEMKPYKEIITDSDATIEMLPIKGGKFMMGSPESEANRKEDEGPQREVEISPFWMAKVEITWDAYDIWMSDLDIFRRQVDNREPSVRDKLADAFSVSQPTKPYTDHDIRDGQTRVSCRMYDPAFGSNFLQMALCQDGAVLSITNRSGMGICLPSRHHNRIFVWRRSRNAG